MRKWMLFGLMCCALVAAGGCASPSVNYCAVSSSMVDVVDDVPQIGAPFNDGNGTTVASFKPEFSTNNADRVMIYDGTISIVVHDVAATIDKLKELAAGIKGYIQEMTERSIVLRIPATQFNGALRKIEELGEVTSEQIKGQDVTEEMMDLDIRMKNMEVMRERLSKLLDKGDKVEDLLKVEKELERVTESIEVMKGRIQYLRHAVAFSTMTVVLNSAMPKKEAEEVIPFAWVRNLGSDLVVSSRSNFEPEWHFFSWLKFNLPKSYVKLYEGDNSTRAMSGDGVMIFVSRNGNFENGNMDFWSRIVRRWLVSSKAIAISKENEIVLDTGIKGVAMEGLVKAGRKDYLYMVAIIANEDFVYTFECWGLAEKVGKDRDALDTAIKSMKIKP
jgi:hypothetical protein